MPQETISAIERGVRRVDLVELMDLCQVLGLDVAAFVAEVRDEVAAGRRKGRLKPRLSGKPRRRR
jgi:hypothetical protein